MDDILYESVEANLGGMMRVFFTAFCIFVLMGCYTERQPPQSTPQKTSSKNSSSNSSENDSTTDDYKYQSSSSNDKSGDDYGSDSQSEDSITEKATCLGTDTSNNFDVCTVMKFPKGQSHVAESECNSGYLTNAKFRSIVSQCSTVDATGFCVINSYNQESMTFYRTTTANEREAKDICDAVDGTWSNTVEQQQEDTDRSGSNPFD